MSDPISFVGRPSAADPNAGLREMIASETRTLDEAEAFHNAAAGSVPRPAANPFVGSPQAIAERRAYLAEMKTRAGLVDPNPDDLARAAIDNRHRTWQTPELDQLAEVEFERVTALNATLRAEAVYNLEKEFTKTGYAQLVSEAKDGVRSGQWREEMALSRPLLQLLSAYGRLNRNHAAEHAALDATIAARRS